jgi:raffinose/stachyose/melibiose transport system substrate-binding protein
MKHLLIGTAVMAGVAFGAFGAVAQELQFWTWRAEDKAQYEQYIDTFEAANPGITVTFSAYESQGYFSALSTALTGGTGPDVMMVRPYGGLETISNGGFLLPLDATNVPALADFPAAALASETSRTDGKTYAVPFASQTMLVIYNKDLFTQAGITEEPQTWDELLAAAEKLKAAGLMPFANGTATAWQNESTFHALTSSIFGRGFYEDMIAGKADFTDARYVEALTAYNDISTKYFPEGFVGLDYPSAQQLFISGLAGMFAGGSFELAAFTSQNPNLNLGIFAAPGKTADAEKLGAIYFDGGYAVNATSKHPEAALKFANYLASLEFGQAFANGLKNISPIPGVTFDSEILQEVADLNAASTIPYIMFVHFRYAEPSGSALLQSEIQKMSAGQQTPEGVGKTVTEGVSAWYEPFKK